MHETLQDNGMLTEPPYHEIFTDRLRLRTARLSDAPLLYPIISKAEVMRHATTPPVTSLSQAERWLKDRVLGPDVFNFAVELRSTGEYIGLIGYFHPPSVGYITSPGIRLRDSTWAQAQAYRMVGHAGKGYTTEALRALVPALFKHLPPAGTSGTGFDYIEGMTDPDNWASRRVLEKAGFSQCETLGNAIDHWLLGLRDTVVYRIARPGKTLEGMGVIEDATNSSVDPDVMPPVQ